MTPLQLAVRRVLADLTHQRLALVGGLAVSARAEPRFTRDVDFAVAVGSDKEAEQLILAGFILGHLVGIRGNHLIALNPEGSLQAWDTRSWQVRAQWESPRKSWTS